MKFLDVALEVALEAIRTSQKCLFGTGGQKGQRVDVTTSLMGVPSHSAQENPSA